MVLTVPKRSKHPEEAVEFALFMTNKANQLTFCQEAPILPSVLEALKDPYFQKVDKNDVMAMGRSHSARQLLSTQEPYRIRLEQNRINKIVDDYVQLALLGKISAADALKKAQQEINQLIDVQ